jgi:taurine dioxygenase
MKSSIGTGSQVGWVIEDFDARNPENSVRIKELLYEHKLLIFKNQTLNESQFCDFSNWIGEAVPYLQSNYHHPDHPLIFVSSNVKKDGKKMGVARTGGYWHSDTSFMAEPIPLTLLYPQLVPQETRRTTLFIDMEQAYANMPASLRERLQGLEFIHSGKWRFKVRAEDVGKDLTEILQMIHQAQPPVIHPAVIQHPVTGQPVLYASRGFTVGVHNMDTDKANALLEEVFAFVEKPEFIHEFQWAMGDIILWDNRFFAHKAGRLAIANDPVNGNTQLEEDTIVYRIIIKDGYALSGGQP